MQLNPWYFYFKICSCLLMLIIYFNKLIMIMATGHFCFAGAAGFLILRIFEFYISYFTHAVMNIHCQPCCNAQV